MRHVLCLVSLCLLAISVSAFEADDNYYKILGVSRSATVKEIKKAYHKMSLEYHPDRNKSPNARDKFATIAEAYEVLKDQDKRQTYDRHGKEGVQMVQILSSNSKTCSEEDLEVWGAGEEAAGVGSRGEKGQN
jgi:DnaJ-class molecular chaperone